MDTNSGFGEILETGHSTVRKAAKYTKQGAQNFVKTGTGQVTASQSDVGINETGSAASQNQMSDDQAKQFLRDLYGVTDKSQTQKQVQTGFPQGQSKTQTNAKTALGLGTSQGKVPSPGETVKTAMGIPEPAPQKTHPSQNQNSVATALGAIPKDPHRGLNPEEIAKLEALRQQLHKDYYESLTKSKKPTEEHVTEKLEREDEEKKMSELEVQKKKPPPLPATVKQGTGETVVGVSG